MKKMFNHIWKEQIVKPTSKVGIFKPKQGFDIEEEEEDNNKCMKEWEAISNYITQGYQEMQNIKFIYNGEAIYENWKRQSYTSDSELNPWAIFSLSQQDYSMGTYIAMLEPGILKPNNEEEACNIIKLVNASIKKKPNYYKQVKSDSWADNSMGIDTRNVYSIPYTNVPHSLFGTSQFILTFENYDYDSSKPMIDWFTSFIYHVGKMFSDAHHRLNL